MFSASWLKYVLSYCSLRYRKYRLIKIPACFPVIMHKLKADAVIPAYVNNFDKGRG